MVRATVYLELNKPNSAIKDYRTYLNKGGGKVHGNEAQVNEVLEHLKNRSSN